MRAFVLLLALLCAVAFRRTTRLLRGSRLMAEATPHARQYARDLLARKDIRGLTELLPSLALAEDDEALFVLSCVSRGINSNKLTQRIVHLGQTFLDKARPHVKDLTLGVLGLELQARRAGLSSTVLADFSDNDSMMNLSPLHQMPEEALLLFLASSDWLPWSSLKRLRSSLLQRSPLPSPRNPPPGAASDTHHVQALAMVRSVQADCDIELLLAQLLSQGQGVGEVLHGPDRESRSFAMATGLLDAASASASGSAKLLMGEAGEWVRGEGRQPQQLERGWSQCSKESCAWLRDAGLSLVLPRTPLPQQLLNQAPKGEGVGVLCVGDGDLSSSLSIARALAQAPSRGSTVVASSLLPDEQSLCRLYPKEARRTIDSLRGSLGVQAVVRWGVDVTRPADLRACLCELKGREKGEEALFDFVVFNFPFNDDQKHKGPKSDAGEASFDTHWVAKGRHMSLLSSLFSSSAAVLRPGGMCVVTLLLRQAVAWEAERLAAQEGFSLARASAHSPGAGATSRRTNTEAPFLVAQDDAWTFFFEKKSSI